MKGMLTLKLDDGREGAFEFPEMDDLLVDSALKEYFYPACAAMVVNLRGGRPIGFPESICEPDPKA